jgi:hypothetical protein
LTSKPSSTSAQLRFFVGAVGYVLLIIVADGMGVVIMGFVAPLILQEWSISRLALGFGIDAAAFGLLVKGVLRAHDERYEKIGQITAPGCVGSWADD